MIDTDGKYAGYAYSLLRIVTALLFIQHGTAKVFDMPHMGLPDTMLGIQTGAIGVLELVGGVLVLIGLFSRLAAFVLAGEMAVGYFMVHAPQSFYPVINHGEVAVLFCFIFLLIAAAGPGKWSVESLRGEDDEPGVEGYAAPGGERQYRPEDFGDTVI